MNQEQTNVSQSTTQPPTSIGRPILVTIIAVLMIIGAALLFVIGIGAVAALMTLSKAPAATAVIVTAILVIPSSILSLISGIGLLKMKKWALYLISILVVLGIIQFVYSYLGGRGINLDNMWSLAIEVVIAIYLWSIYKQFK